LTLIGLTFSGVMYQILNTNQQEKIISVPRKLSFALRNGVVKVTKSREHVVRRIGSVKGRLNGCEKLLSNFKQITNSPAEDPQ
jgi:hypothetical protein